MYIRINVGLKLFVKAGMVTFYQKYVGKKLKCVRMEKNKGKNVVLRQGRPYVV